MDYSYIDAFSKLIVIILRTDVNIKKNEVLERICDSILIVLTKYHENVEGFNQRPFFKLLLNLIYDIKRPEYSFEDNEVLNLFTMFVKLFDKLQPIKYPGFSFAWLELVSNRYFMPTLLANHEYWINFHVLILHLLKYFKSTISEETISNLAM